MRTLLFVAVAVSLTGCRVTSSSNDVHPWDVRGNYALTYDDRLTAELSIGGALRHLSSTGHDVVSFGDFNGQPLMLDMAAFCARPDVACPDEAMEPLMAIDQTGADTVQPRHAIDLVGDSGVHHDGVVDHTAEDTFLVGLAAPTSVSCTPLPASVTTGRFTHRGETSAEEPMWLTADGSACNAASPDGGGDCSVRVSPGGVVWPGDAPVDGIADGRIVTAWSGGCAFAGLPAGATLSFATNYVGSRLGDYNPPVVVDASAAIDASTD